MTIEPVAASNRDSFAALLLRLRAKALDTTPLLAALSQTPRDLFVAAGDGEKAYHNRVLPLPCGEYIERIDEQIAAIVALKLEKHHRVLEIGTGSGFTAALIARLVARGTTIERYKTLLTQAQTRLGQLKIDTVILHHGDAHHGLAAHHGAFDRIIIWPSWQRVPQIFVDRLAAAGMLIVPIGEPEQVQQLSCIKKNGSRLEQIPLFPVRYQPMLSGIAYVL